MEDKKMKKYNHLNIEDRMIIESLIKLSYSCNQIANALGRSESTIRREIKANRSKTNPNFFNNYTPEYCSCTLKFPFVCNNCPKRNGKKVFKYYYIAHEAHQNYTLVKSHSRTGSNFSDSMINLIDNALIDGIKRNQPINHIIHSNDLPISKSTVYRWIHEGVVTPKIIDLQKAIRYKSIQHKPKRSNNSKNRIDRTYNDYLDYIAKHPDLNVIEMDIVEGTRSDNKCILTFACLKTGLLFSRLLPNQSTASVINALDDLEHTLGHDLFSYLFGVILTDNGSEFNNALGIESSCLTNIKRTKLFYCDPNRSDQKGTIERKHVDMRYIIPKKFSIEHLTQKKVDLMNSHVNGISRPTLNNQSTYNFARFLHGETIVHALGIKYIDPKQVTLKPILVK